MFWLNKWPICLMPKEQQFFKLSIFHYLSEKKIKQNTMEDTNQHRWCHSQENDYWPVLGQFVMSILKKKSKNVQKLEAQQLDLTLLDKAIGFYNSS